MSVYAPLQKQLASTNQSVVRLSFADIERLLGRRLPPSAYDDKIKRQWWANTDTHSQARAWLSAGRKAKLDAAANAVAFVREERPPGQQLTIADSALTGAARQLLTSTAREHGIDLAEAAARLLNEAARERRKSILNSFVGRSKHSSVSSADLIREDRDAR